MIKRVALKFSYIGRNYNGLALAENKPTIASALIKALKATKLYYTNPVFCGRTDTGVNAKSMVASIDIKVLSNKINLVAVLNTKLPDDIIIIAYAFVDDFNARFDCVQRHYKYFFTDWNIKMEWVVEKLKHVKNFKALCRTPQQTTKTCKHCRNNENSINIDPPHKITCSCNKPIDFNRTIDSIKIIKTNNLFYLDVKARSFLHNMIRKMFWLINSYGKGRVDELFVESICVGKGYCGTERAENLVFCCAKYEKCIEWKYSVDKKYIEKRNGNKVVEHCIDRFIYDY